MSDALDAATVDALSARFDSLLEARALWHWAGGSLNCVPSGAGVGPTWTALWACARDGADGAAGVAALLREALFEHPGDAELTGLARRWLDENRAGALDLAHMSLVGLQHADSDGRFAVALEILAEPHRAEACLSLAVAMNNRLGSDQRAALLKRCTRRSDHHVKAGADACLPVELRDACSAAVDRCWQGSGSLRDSEEMLRAIAKRWAAPFAELDVVDGYVVVDDVDGFVQRELVPFVAELTTVSQSSGSLRLRTFARRLPEAVRAALRHGEVLPYPSLEGRIGAVHDAVRATVGTL